MLDSLAGEFVDASLRLLPRGGRFVEMGKTDIRDAEHRGRRAPRRRATSAFDLVEAGPERIGEMLTELIGAVRSRARWPAAAARLGLRRAPEAFRFMSQARHIGKIVLTMPAPGSTPRAPS